MPSTPPITRPEPEYEGDYRPADSDNPHAHIDPVNVRIESTDLRYLAQIADTLNTTLDLQTLLNRTSELVRSIIPLQHLRHPPAERPHQRAPHALPDRPYD